MFYPTLTRATRAVLPRVAHLKPVISPMTYRLFWSGASQKFNADEFADMLRRLGQAYEKAHEAMEHTKTEVTGLEKRIDDASARTELIEDTVTDIEGRAATVTTKTEVLETTLSTAQKKNYGGGNTY